MRLFVIAFCVWFSTFVLWEINRSVKRIAVALEQRP